MKELIIDLIKTILLFTILIIVLVFLVKTGEEKPHTVTIDGKEYIRMTEWNGDHYQIILLPSDKK